MLKRTFVYSIALALVCLPAFAGGNKVDVCHLPPGNPDNWHTISVSSNALAAHLGHGDLEGSCAANCEALCDDGDACTQDVESDFDQCLCSTEPRPAVNCDDSNPCTLDACNSGFGCTYDTAALDGTACDDGDPDTTGDSCSGGVCSGDAAITCAGDHESFSGAWPWQLSLQRFDGSAWQHHCGATLLSANYALTAASCVVGESAANLRVIAGLHDRNAIAGTQTSVVSSFTAHGDFDDGSTTLANDIAVLTLSTAINVNGGTIQFASLPPDNSNDFVGETSTFTGWGETALAAQMPADILQQESLFVIAEPDCNVELAIYTGANIGSGQFCSSGSALDPCTGDIGGPVMAPSDPFNYYVVGIQSWPVDLIEPYSNAASIPRVATRISHYLGWISDNTP